MSLRDERRPEHKFDPARADRLDAPERDAYLPNAPLVDLLGLRGEETVIEYGAGTGRLAIAVRAALGAGGRVIAVEENDEMLVRLRDRVPAAGAEVEAVGITANQVPEPDGTADRVLAVNLLHEIRGEGALEEMRRLLRPDGLLEVKEAELLAAMDWLLERQERIERALAKRHLAGEGFVLYDLSSSYVEGRECPLATLGYSRDGKKGKLQVNYGLVCSPEGRPVAVSVYPGSAQDQTTVPDAIDAVRGRFGIERVVFVGDRGMITQAHATALKEQGVDFISALKAPQIKALVEAGDLQLSLFDELNLAEITSERFPGERLVVCRNPAVAAERTRKRSELLAATEGELDKVRAMVEGPRGSLLAADAGKIGDRAGRVVNRFKVAKHFELRIDEGSFFYQRKTDQIAAEAALDGLYVIRTTCSADLIGAAATVRAYKQLKVAELTFKAMKSALEVRPIHHHLETRVRAHILLCMLAYYVAFELQARLAPLLFTDTEPLSPTDPVAPARRSAAAKAKAGSAATPDGHPAHSFGDLIAELGTLARNDIRIGGREHTFARLTTPTPLHARAFELLDIKLHP